MSSRNALRSDFERVMAAIKDRRVVPGDYITHRYPFHTLAREFMTLLDPANGVIKALALLGDQP
jgi:threonine dehydrogenase-like Zn-dependent dehydrogenase